MRTFNVTLVGEIYESFTVEANNSSQAIKYAKEDFIKQFKDHIEEESTVEATDVTEE
jgi:hypothetical protein